MGDDDRHSSSTVPDSMPPELDSIDSSWDDDLLLEESTGIPAPDPAIGLEFDRPTGVPQIPPEERARMLMRGVKPESAERTGDLEPEPVVGLEFDEPGSHRESEPELRVVHPGPSSQEVVGPGDFDPPSIPPLLASAVVPSTAHQRKPHQSQEIDDLSLDLSEPDGAVPGAPGEQATPAVASPSLELDLHGGATPTPFDPAVADMKDRYAMGDFTGALVIAESILENDPEDLEALRYVQSCRDVLTQMYAARLGSLDQRVVVAIPPDQIRWLSLDHRAGFLLSLIDGSSNVEEILDISGMTRLEAFRILYNLLEQRVIALEPA